MGPQGVKEPLYCAAVEGTLTVVCVDEVRGLRGVVDELDFVDLPHLNTLFAELLDKNTPESTRRRGSCHPGPDIPKCSRIQVQLLPAQALRNAGVKVGVRAQRISVGRFLYKF